KELQHPQVDRRVEPQTALVGANGTVHLDTEAAVDMHLAAIIHPRHAEHDYPLGLDQALNDASLEILRVLLQEGPQGAQHFFSCLMEFGLLWIAQFEMRQAGGQSISHGSLFFASLRRNGANLSELCTLRNSAWQKSLLGGGGKRPPAAPARGCPREPGECCRCLFSKRFQNYFRSPAHALFGRMRGGKKVQKKCDFLVRRVFYNGHDAAGLRLRPGVSCGLLQTRCSCPRRISLLRHPHRTECAWRYGRGTSGRGRSRWPSRGSRAALPPVPAGFPRPDRWTVRPAAARWRPVSASSPDAGDRAHPRTGP